MEKREKLKKLLESKKVSEILREHPELADEIDKMVKEIKQHSLAAAQSVLIKRTLQHLIKKNKKK